MSELLAGRYELRGRLGAGAMGVVWLAHDLVLDRPVALKELRAPEGLDRDEALSRFLTEAQAAARLSHPAIVTVHDVFVDDDRVLMSLELLEGSTLADVIAEGGLGSASRSVATAVAEALAAAHGQGIVHRDLKPDNVFLLPTGRVVVCDFGLARIGAGRGTRIGTVMGTPGYMAPEQTQGHESGPQADVFAWGVVAYETITGHNPFGPVALEDPMTTAWRVVHDEPESLALPDDPQLAEIVAWALQKDPSQRPHSGEALLAALFGGLGAPPRPAPVAAHQRRQARAAREPLRRRGLVVGVVAAGTVLLGLLGVLAGVLLGGAPPTQAEFTAVEAPGFVENVRSAGAASEAPEPPAWGTFIVQIASRDKATFDRTEAEREAGNAFGPAGDEIAVLESDDYVPAMRAGYWVIYAGPFATREEAHDAHARLASWLPQDARVRYLDQYCTKAWCT